jgi:hypothetical protein
VGIAKSVPDSFVPRRFIRVTKPTNPIAIGTLEATNVGAAETMASTPAVIETETVRT